MMPKHQEIEIPLLIALENLGGRGKPQQATQPSQSLFRD